MFRPVSEICIKAGLSLGITWLFVTLFDSLLLFGESRIQTVIVFGFYLYCVIVLLTPSEHKLFHVLAIPVLTQFLHLFQKYDFPAGANSLWRLLPFVATDIYLASMTVRRKTGITFIEKCVATSWIILQFAFIIISPNLTGVVIGAIVLFLVTLPAYFMYFGICARNPSFGPELERCLALLFIILAIGTFGLVFLGIQYKGADNLLVTRNISDTNVTMAYFILLWPFVLLHLKRIGNPILPTFILILLFVAVVILSFSRGAVFIVTPYLVMSLLIGIRKRRLALLMAAGIGTFMIFSPTIESFNSDITYPWQLRFGELHSAGPVLQKLQEASGRANIRGIAYGLFLESPLYGHGTASFEVLGPGYREAHSLFYTSLAEQGIFGTLYLYTLFVSLGYCLLNAAKRDGKNSLLLLSFGAYLVFVHSVGSVFVIIPAKSLTINCIAPLLLICLYYYSKAGFEQRTVGDNG